MKYKIGDLSNLLNVSTNTVRRYEEMGYISSERNEETGYRYYSEDEITKFMNARLLRKYGFNHTEISRMMSYDIHELKLSFEERMTRMDQEIEYLKNLRHRLKDDIGLMNRIDIFQKPDYIKDCMPLIYVLYQSGDRILKEKKRLETVQDFLYRSPEVQRIYIIRKKDVDEDNIILNMGWAIKTMDQERFHIVENEYTEKYESTKSLLRLAKLPVNTDEVSRGGSSWAKDILLKETFEYMKDNGLKLNGDIIGIAIAIVIEDGEEMQYILMSFPITDEKTDKIMKK